MYDLIREETDLGWVSSSSYIYTCYKNVQPVFFKTIKDIKDKEKWIQKSYDN